MKKRTISIISVIIGVSFLALLFLQLKYMESMATMKREQFDESAGRALYQAARNLELNETLRFLEKDINEVERKQKLENSTNVDADSMKSVELKSLSQILPTSIATSVAMRSNYKSNSDAQETTQEIVRNRYIYQKALLDEVVYSILYSASDKSLKERINFKQLDQDIKTELSNNGINIPYHFIVTTQDGREVYRCPDYEEDGNNVTYSQVLFRNDQQSKMGIVTIHFPDMNRYIFSSVRYMIPSLIFTGILIITFIFTLVVVFRQKKYSEMKNDFINNMTHELKTPISSISLAAQMLNDKSITKSEHTINHLGGVIKEETDRLRFLVEKVLQMSMFDKKKAVFKRKELDLNELVDNAAHSFALRVEHTGGKIVQDIGAIDSTMFADEVHFTNVIFNLMDNAIKYAKSDRPLNIILKTWNDDQHLYLSVEDNGVGVKKENQKKIFDKFYRVHTGNVHDVKGFGLGLAYVKKIVDLHDGDIRIDSEYGKGTTFTISLPIVKSE